MRAVLRTLAALAAAVAVSQAGAESERGLKLEDFAASPRTLTAEVDDSGQFTWWLPDGADAVTLPTAGGVVVDAANPDARRWLKQASPHDLTKLPVVGARFGERTAVVIAPWPHYAELVAGDRLGVRFSFPRDRRKATPCQIVCVLAEGDPLAPARAFRAWRASAKDLGAIPPPRPLVAKIRDLPNAERLLGAPHFYLWGPPLFSRHDVARGQWKDLAKRLLQAAPSTVAGRLATRFTADERQALSELAKGAAPANYLTREVAAGVERALRDRSLLPSPADWPLDEVVAKNAQAFAEAFPGLTAPPERWGDGYSLPMLEALREAGLDRALLVLSDFHGQVSRPHVAAKAAELGYLLGPYDSYHSVHDPRAAPDDTWETAQFDQTAFERGRVQNADGSGHAGFKKRGFHFAPAAAWPYVQRRVGQALSRTPFSTWFMDCDATVECFDDYHPDHPATRADDVRLRRERLRWLEATHRQVVGSEEGSVLFADVIHYGHGIATPYLGHLAPEFRDRDSPHFLGRHWPPDTPAVHFAATTAPAAIRSPYFDHRARVPLYQAALGDEVIVTHHWSFDSLKFRDLAAVRQLLELLHLTPPMYHVNRETWPDRKERVIRHFQFWSPLHRRLATAPMTSLQWLTTDRDVQRTTFATAAGDVTITVNFSEREREGLAPLSAKVGGAIDVAEREYRLAGE